MQGTVSDRCKLKVKFIVHTCALLLSGSDIRFLGTTGPEPEPEYYQIVKNSRISGHPEPELDIRYIPNNREELLTLI